jgi:hypothetical protein
LGANPDSRGRIRGLGICFSELFGEIFLGAGIEGRVNGGMDGGKRKMWETDGDRTTDGRREGGIGR